MLRNIHVMYHISAKIKLEEIVVVKEADESGQTLEANL